MTLNETPIKDQFDRQVNPGDAVGFMTFSRYPCFGKGTYMGICNGRARILEDYEALAKHDPETGEDLTNYRRFNEWIIGKIGPYQVYPSGRIEKSEFSRLRDAYYEYRKKRHELHDTLETRWHPATRVRVLQNNIIFKL